MFIGINVSFFENVFKTSCLFFFFSLINKSAEHVSLWPELLLKNSAWVPETLCQCNVVGLSKLVFIILQRKSKRICTNKHLQLHYNIRRLSAMSGS